MQFSLLFFLLFIIGLGAWTGCTAFCVTHWPADGLIWRYIWGTFAGTFMAAFLLAVLIAIYKIANWFEITLRDDWEDDDEEVPAPPETQS